MRKFKVGDKVVKNPNTWAHNDLDVWGRGSGVGEVVEPTSSLGDNEVDVRWPAGRCFENETYLQPPPTGDAIIDDYLG